ncbi:MAG: DUF4250 domain-containing protein [Bacilli bacterium]|nr:DUF4250 domain-containing protein [Bacilli bacterium]
MVSLSFPIELLVSILNTYLRSKYQNITDLCEYENLDIDELNQKLIDNSYEYNEETNQIRYKN